MKLFKTSLILSFLAAAAFCVGYAHSTTSQPEAGTTIYTTNHWFMPNCKLKVEQEGSTVYFSADGASKTRFAGFWPQAAGAIEIPAVMRASFEGDDQLQKEKLTVQFGKVDGELRPVSYAYVNETGREVLPAVGCSNLKLKN